jgi:hypothetical protein
MYPAMENALQELTKTKASVKHIIVLTDGRTEPGDFKTLVNRIKDEKITLSAVGVGRDTDIPFLQEISEQGKGRFYYTDNATLLPRIFVRETILAGRSALVEETFSPQIVYPAEFLKGVDLTKVPKLYGYVVTAPKNEAILSMQTHQKDPLFAYWRIGLGKSVAFTSDDGLRWGRDWVNWDNYRKFWAQTIRWAMPEPESERYSMSTGFEGGRGKITIEALDDDGNPVNFLNLNTNIVEPSGKTSDVPLRQVSSGRYEATFEANEVGTYYTVLLDGKNGKYKKAASQPLSVSYSQEYNTFETNNYLLNKIAASSGGKIISKADDVFQKTGKIAYIPRSAWKELLLLALFMFPLDVGLRRVYLPENFGMKIWNSVFRTSFSGKTQMISQQDELSVKMLRLKKEKIKDQLETQKEKDTPLLEKLAQRKGKISEITVSKLKADEISIDQDVKEIDLKGPSINRAEIAAENLNIDKTKKPQEMGSSTLSRLKEVKKRSQRS